MTTQEFATKWFAALDAKDYGQLKSLLAPNHQFTNPMLPEPLNAEGHIEMIQQMMTAFTGGHTIEQTIREGDWIAVRGKWHGTHVGDFNGIPATGKSVEFPFTDIMHIVNGKLAEEAMEWNALGLLTAIGAFPQMA